jgi:hypothetical protein
LRQTRRDVHGDEFIVFAGNLGMQRNLQKHFAQPSHS